MASMASIGGLDRTRYNEKLPDTPPQHSDEQEDYFAIDECYEKDHNSSPPNPSIYHSTSTHTQRIHPQSGSAATLDGRGLYPNKTIHSMRRVSADDVIPVMTPHAVTARTSRNTTDDNDYENQEILESQLAAAEEEDSSEDEGERRVIKSVIKEDLDYINSGELDRELEIMTGNGGLAQTQKPGDLELKSGQSTERSGTKTKWNGTLGSKLDDPDYENSEAIDAELFKDNIKPRDSGSLSFSTTSGLGLSEHPLREHGDSRRVAKSGDSPPVGAVKQRYSRPQKKMSTLHRESEIKIEPAENTGVLDPTLLNTTSGANCDLPDGLGDSGSNLLLTERVKSSIPPLTVEPSYRGKQKSNVDDLSGLGSFERTLLGPTTASMPNVLEIPWYHEGITRHVAESLLMSKTIKDGTYLLRDSVHSKDSVTLSVRCQHSVKHYRILWDGKQFTFGLGKFPDLESLKQHFDNQPVISGESGILVKLKYPYPRAVAEPAIYFDPDSVNDAKDTDANCGSPSEKLVPKKWAKKDKAMKTAHQAQSVPELSVNSKEGFLTKQGLKVKNWKRRWFVLFRNELSYYMTQESKEPIKVIDLNDAVAVERDESQGKPHCFKLVTSYRTFFMYGTSETETNEWVQVLDWKLNRRSRSNSRV